MSKHRYAAALFGIATLLALPAAANAQGSRAESHRRGWIGVRPYFNVTVINGQRSERVVVYDIVKDSPADRAGVRPGDRILRINGKDASPGSLSELSRDLSPGDTVRLRITDGERERDVIVVAAEQPRDVVTIATLRSIAPRDSVLTKARIFMDSALRVLRDTAITLRIERAIPHEFVFPFDTFRLRMLHDSDLFGDGGARVFQFRTDGFEFPDIEFFGSRSVSGAEFTELNDGLSSYFGTADGLLVLKVSPGTPAARAGLEPGDVITRVNDEEVRTINELRTRVMRARGEPVRLEILRKGQKRMLAM